MKGALGMAGSALIAAPLSLLLLVGAVQEDADAAEAAVGAPSSLRSGSVPAKYVPLLAAAARTCPEITAPVLAAQIHAESNWRADAVSPDGAQGLSQFMPGTWSEYGTDGDGDGRADPLNPADAITSQAVYDCRLVAQLRGWNIRGDILDLTLAAYNAGPGAVLTVGGVPNYPETQAYVRKIRILIATYATVTTGPGRWVHPLAGNMVLTAPFGSRGDRWGNRHTGSDFRAKVGRPIYAAADGVVTAAGPVGGRNAWAGQWVRIDHGASIETLYAHISAWNVNIGQRVQAGQPIAAAGSEGNSSASHLHFEVRLDGDPVDPIDYYATHGVKLP